MPMPNMASTLRGWQVPITLQKIIQNVVDGDLISTVKNINFQGCWQPLRMEDLQSKPENMRSWSWYWLHTHTNIKLLTGDKVYYKNTRYKVMSVKDYSINGFYEYELIQDYESYST